MNKPLLNRFWQDRRVFVTGSTGLVGSWLVEKLVKLQADVVVLVRDWVPQSRLLQSDAFKKIIVLRGDLSTAHFLERVLAEYEIKTVIHLAAQTIVPISNKNPLSTFESNIAGTWNLLEACRQCRGIESIVVASSDKAYGAALDLPYQENTPLKAVFPYDVSKACADMISTAYAKTWDLPIAITRCGNFFGGGDLNWSRIIPGTIRSILREQRPVIRSNGELVRDYIYVEDAVSAYLTLAQALTEKPALKGEAFNFSTESPITALNMVQKILQLMDSMLTPLVLDTSTAEIQAQYLSAAKARNLLGWQAQFNLDDGLKKTIAWYHSLLKEPQHAL